MNAKQEERVEKTESGAKNSKCTGLKCQQTHCALVDMDIAVGFVSSKIRAIVISALRSKPCCDRSKSGKETPTKGRHAEKQVEE